MTSPFYQRLEQELERRRRDHLLREIRPWERLRLNLCGNDYLMLRQSPDILAGAREAEERFGTSSAASPLLSGFLPCHAALLDQLKAWKKKPCGMLFNTGFMANQAILKHLPGPRDVVLADRLIHHSMAQSLAGGPARFMRYPHLNLDRLEEMLAGCAGKYETVFVATESVFSMDGDRVDLKRLAAMKERTPFVLVLDEAHGTGVYGPSGAGLAEEAGVEDAVDILVGTLGKALASMGAYVLARDERVIAYLTNFSGEFIYSTFLPPAQAGAALAAIARVQASGKERQALRSMSKAFRQRLAELGWPADEGDSPIVPVITGDAGRAIEIRDRLLAAGILVGAVRPPTVPRGTARLRISLHSGVTEDDLDEIIRHLMACPRV